MKKWGVEKISEVLWKGFNERRGGSEYWVGGNILLWIDNKVRGIGGEI